MLIRADIPAPSTRRSIEDAIERLLALLALLDRLEGDPDLEANGKEHDASWPEGYSGARRVYRISGLMPLGGRNRNKI